MIYLREEFLPLAYFLGDAVMNADKFDYQIYKLSDTFYEDYPVSQYPELLEKNMRPYNCLLIETKHDYFICVPYRTEINHEYAYKFKKSLRSRKHSSGLDYSKMVIIKDLSYIDSQNPALVDKDEYDETRIHISKIADGVNSYLGGYLDHYNGNHVLPAATFKRKYKYATLRYFHKELNIK